MLAFICVFYKNLCISDFLRINLKTFKLPSCSTSRMTGKFYGNTVNNLCEIVRGQPALYCEHIISIERQSNAQIDLVSIRSLELSNICFANDRAFYYIGSFIILCLLHEVRLQSTEFAFRPFETEIVLKSVKRCALNDDRRRQCPSRRPIFASFHSVYFPPFVFICLSSSSLLEVHPNPWLEYGQL